MAEVVEVIQVIDWTLVVTGTLAAVNVGILWVLYRQLQVLQGQIGVLRKEVAVLQQTTQLSSLERIIVEYGNEESRRDRRLLYEAFFNTRPPLFADTSYLDPLRDPDQKRVPGWLESKRDELFQASERVRNSLDRIGFLVEAGYLPFDDRLVEFIGKSATDMWNILEPLLMQRRIIRKDPTTGRQFQRFAQRIQDCWPKVVQSLEEQ